MVEAKVSVNFLFFVPKLSYGLGQASEVTIRFNYWKLEIHIYVSVSQGSSGFIYL